MSKMLQPLQTHKVNKAIIIIQARMGSTRLYGKPLVNINGKPMIWHVWSRAIKSNIGPVVVATDTKEIADKIIAEGGNAIITSETHLSGSDRVFEAIEKVDSGKNYELVINLQGDIPNFNSENLKSMMPENYEFDICTFVTQAKKSEIEQQSVAYNAIADVSSYAMNGWNYYKYYKPAPKTRTQGIGPGESMARFGNVLGSSGSVVQTFIDQINNGGPLTITDEEVTRFFMTIEEAANLVIQSAQLANGGEVFHLDMGKPVRINDLAKNMIVLSGKSIKNKENPNGEIEIKTIGLRPGEKLFEELLIDSIAEKTKNEKIYKAYEKYIPNESLNKKILKLVKLLNDQKNIINVIKLTKELVPEWDMKDLNLDIN